MLTKSGFMAVVSLILFALANSGVAEDPSKETVKVQFTFQDKAGDPVTPTGVLVLKAGDPVLEGNFLAQQISYGRGGADKLAVTPDKPSSDGNRYTCGLEPGAYHFMVRYRDGAVWLTDQGVADGKSLERTVELPKAGTLKGTWTVDESISDVEGNINVSLVKDGMVCAFASGKESFELKAPAGTYALVAEHKREDFVWLVDGVKIREGKETKIKLTVKRKQLGGVYVRFVDRRTGKVVKPSEGPWPVLFDGKSRFALNSTATWGDQVGWLDLPVGNGYVVYASFPGYKPVKKGSIRIAYPKIEEKKDFSGNTVMRMPVYKVVKIDLTPE